MGDVIPFSDITPDLGTILRTVEPARNIASLFHIVDEAIDAIVRDYCHTIHSEEFGQLQRGSAHVCIVGSLWAGSRGKDQIPIRFQ
jgi:hypothetical protein